LDSTVELHGTFIADKTSWENSAANENLTPPIVDLHETVATWGQCVDLHGIAAKIGRHLDFELKQYVIFVFPIDVRITLGNREFGEFESQKV
jgi:hypothetical protein